MTNLILGLLHGLWTFIERRLLVFEVCLCFSKKSSGVGSEFEAWVER